MELIICTNDGVYNYIEGNKNKLNKIELLTGKYYRGIKINNNIIALINYEIQNKENNLIFYNLNTKKVYKINEKNSLNINIKSSLLSISKNNNNVLLCAYKKHSGQQQNGILLINFDNNLDFVSKDFNDIYDFEVHCLCAYSSISNNNCLFSKNNIEIKEENYILVGGYDIKKGNGLIKLYNIIYEKEKIEIKYKEDIDFSEYNNINEFKSPITDIKQSKINGKILIRCLDGKVYLMSKLNI